MFLNKNLVYIITIVLANGHQIIFEMSSNVICERLSFKDELDLKQDELTVYSLDDSGYIGVNRFKKEGEFWIESNEYFKYKNTEIEKPKLIPSCDTFNVDGRLGKIIYNIHPLGIESASYFIKIEELKKLYSVDQISCDVLFLEDWYINVSTEIFNPNQNNLFFKPVKIDVKQDTSFSIEILGILNNIHNQ